MKYCKQCGAQMNDASAFCPKCGTQASASAQPVTPPNAAEDAERTVAIERPAPPVQQDIPKTVAAWTQTAAPTQAAYSPAAQQSAAQQPAAQPAVYPGYTPVYVPQPAPMMYRPAAQPSPLAAPRTKAPMLALGALLTTIINLVLMFIPHVSLVFERYNYYSDSPKLVTAAKAPVFSLLNVAYSIWTKYTKAFDWDEDEILDELGEAGQYITMAKVFYIIWFICLIVLLLSMVYLVLPMAKKKAVGAGNFVPLIVTTLISFAIQTAIMIIAATQTKAYEDEINALIKISAGGWIFIAFSAINIIFLCVAAATAGKERRQQAWG
ncbi:MAG: zinc-ribbon domain-containing protein [Clostridia bacterium]|nr:zinc-ribbon domain-containing protein [Clostridia bacterium]